MSDADLPYRFDSRRDNGPDYQVETVTLPICSACLDGVGGYCYVPGCVFWMSRAPEHPIRWRLVEGAA